MSFAETAPPPAKKRRFFVEQSSFQDGSFEAASASSPAADLAEEASSSLPDDDRGSIVTDAVEGNQVAPHDEGEFDPVVFETIVSDKLDEDSIIQLRERAGNSMERAINIYFDGSWRNPQPAVAERGEVNSSLLRLPPPEEHVASPQQVITPNVETTTVESLLPTRSRITIPSWRYIGAFGVEAWATRSGSALLRPSDGVRIERQKIQPHTVPSRRGGKTKAAMPPRSTNLNKRADILVRFTNQRGEEVGRLPQDVAAWVSTLLDQKICKLEGVCVFCPDRIRVNDTVYLQLRCSLLKTAFESGAFQLQDNNRVTGIFEAKETLEEKDLRLRQVALVKLFDEINLRPTRMNEAAETHKRQGLLRAAEIVERPDKGDDTNRTRDLDHGGSSPSSDDPEDGAELEQNQLDTLYKKAQSFDFDTPATEPADTFAMHLRHYQKQALHWMVGKERNEKLENKGPSMHPLWEEYSWPTMDVDGVALETMVGPDHFYVNPYSGELSLEFPVQEQNCLGGILADEMGLGKTIEMLSLIHSHKSDVALTVPQSVASSVNSLPRLPKNSSSVEKAPCTTLVVAPMSLLAQWQSEAENASKPGTMKSLVYYGSDKIGNLQNLCCEANAATAPNLVITSYGVVLSEFNQVAAANNGNRGSHGGLFSLDFFRLILDEAHHIKNRQSKTAKACYEICAQHRWVLTGTPIVNRLEDLFSLVRFLKVEPWSNFSYWKTFITVPFESKDYVRALDVVQSVLEPIVLRRTKDMRTPNGEALVPLPPKAIEIEEIELSTAEREVYDHIYSMAKQTYAVNVAAGTLLKSYTTIFAQILRLRQSCCHPVLVRNKHAVTEEEHATAAADAASGLADDMDLQGLIERFTSEEGEQNANKFGAHALKQIQDELDNECPICSEEPMIDQSVTGCWHSACKICLLDYIEHQKEKGEGQVRCFNCREPINERDIFMVIKHEDRPYESGNDDDDGSGVNLSLRRIHSHSSAKITALVTHLNRLRREDKDMKTVVFSQFTSFLDLIEPALARDHIRFLRFDGSMPQKQRAAVLAEFAGYGQRSSSSSSTLKQTIVGGKGGGGGGDGGGGDGGGTGVVLLLSLRAGGVGLNLTHAKRVFMMDPWWSFAVESQAIDRVHRMGQENPVIVHRFIVNDSVEQRMLKIQDRKKFIASSLGMMSNDEKRLQTIQDIKDLLS